LPPSRLRPPREKHRHPVPISSTGTLPRVSFPCRKRGRAPPAPAESMTISDVLRDVVGACRCEIPYGGGNAYRHHPASEVVRVACPKSVYDLGGLGAFEPQRISPKHRLKDMDATLEFCKSSQPMRTVNVQFRVRCCRFRRRSGQVFFDKYWATPVTDAPHAKQNAPGVHDPPGAHSTCSGRPSVAPVCPGITIAIAGFPNIVKEIEARVAIT